jgi:Big-like domain-containing protein
MKLRLVRTMLAASVAVALASPAEAALQRLGPVNNAPSVGGFPAWVQDTTGLAMEFCDLTSVGELNSGWCTLIPPGPVYPETFPTNFYVEHFYWDANTNVAVGTSKATLTMAFEAGFSAGVPVAGQQMPFGRIRVFITHLPSSGTYTVYHPYGKWTFPGMVAGDRIFFTQDVGLACPGTFTCSLGTDIGPFLVPSNSPGGAELPPIPDLLPGQDPLYDILVNTGTAKPYPNNGKKYLTDPGRLGPVTGSPLAPFVGSDGVTYNHNIFRVEGPAGYLAQTSNFAVTGRVMTGSMVGQVTVDRASYAQTVTSATGKKLDVFATGQASTAGRVPGQPAPAAVTPILTFFDAPCGGTVDPTTGAILPPFTAPVGATETQMVAAATKYWGQAHPTAIPPAACVEDSTSRNLAGQVVPTFYMVPVTDEVTAMTGSGAAYDPANGGTLSLSVKSSDTLVPPVLDAGAYGLLANGLLTVTPLAAPPSKVTVNSSEGGSTDLLVQTAVGTAGGGPLPLALNDDFAMNEDCSPLPATSCATPFVFNPLANDTFNGLPLPAGSIVTITSAPRIGTLVVNLDGSMVYTPNANVNGAEGIGYTVTVNGLVSNIAYITINIAPINDIPVAVNDTATAVVNKANSINVLANDTDIDGIADLANAQIVTWPAQLGAKPVPVAGVITYTPTTTGTFSFTYNAVDKANAVSANAATATITVTGSETILYTKSIYKAGTQGGVTARWTVSGTDSVKGGQTLTIAYNNGTLNAANGGGSCNGTATNPKCVVGTAVVDALGNWLYDQVLNAGGPSDPTDANTWATKPTVINTFSSSPVLGGSKTATITLK